MDEMCVWLGYGVVRRNIIWFMPFGPDNKLGKEEPYFQRIKTKQSKTLRWNFSVPSHSYLVKS